MEIHNLTDLNLKLMEDAFSDLEEACHEMKVCTERLQESMKDLREALDGK